MKAPEKFSADAIRAEAEKKIHHNETIARIYPLIPDSVEGLKVFICATSYSADYWLNIERDIHTYREQKEPSAAILRDLAAAFPPEPVAKYKGEGTTSFLPVAVFESWPEKKKDRFDDESRIAPFILEIEPGRHSRKAEINWWSVVEGIGRVKVSLAFPLDRQTFGVSTVQYERCGQFGREERVVRNDFGVNSPLQIIRSGEGDDRAGAEVDQMRYASGSHETPGQIVVFWYAYTGLDVTLEALVTAMEEVEQERAAHATA